MGIGTVDRPVDATPRVVSANGGESGDRRGGGDDGPSRGNGVSPFGEMEKSFEKIRLVTWFILLVVMMTFVGLIAAYVVVSTNGAIEWRPFDLPVQVWISTGVLLASSITYSLAHRFRVAGAVEGAKRWLLATTALGGIFIASQMVVWIALYREGYYLQSNPYAGFFYFITALHAVHVVGGICALCYAVLRTWTPTESEEEIGQRISVSKSVGEYWHFMDALWVVLVLMLGFWK